ncbi:MAG: PAS domain S-box protein [Patescibacteria group bacterium]
MNKKISNITDVISLRTLQRIQDNFSGALGVTLSIYDTRGKKLTKTSNQTRFWKEIIEDNNLIYPECKRNIQKAIEAAIHKADIYALEDYCDTTIFTVPITINDKVVAVYVSGRGRKGNPDLKRCHEEAERLGLDFDNFLEAYLELPFLDDHKIEAITRLLKTTANTISGLSFVGSQSKEKLKEAEYMNQLLEEEIEIRNIALLKSERKYRTIVENALDIICTMDPDGILTSINEIGTKYIGLPKEEIVGTHYSNYIYPKDLPAIKKEIQEIKNGERDAVTDLQYQGNRSDRNFSIRAKALRDSSGNLIEIDCIIRDITEKADLQKELETTKEKFKDLFDAVPDVIYSCDFKTGEFTAINQAGCKLFGYSEEEIIGKPVETLYVNPKDRKMFLEEIEEKGYYHGFIAHLKHRSGRDFYVETYSNLKRDKNGNPVAVEGVLRDVTTRIRLSHKLQESEQKFKDIFENAFDAIILIDEKGNIFDANKKAKRLYGEKTINIKKILEQELPMLIQNATKRGNYNIPMTSIEVAGKTHYVSLAISKIKTNSKTLFHIIAHNIESIIQKKPGKVATPRIKAKVKV